MATPAICLDDVKRAREALKGKAHVTPVMTCSTFDALAGGRELYFKCENFQKVGAFKFRGAWNSISQLSDADKAKGVVTHSSGNHAQALSLAAKMAGISAVVVMPSTAPSVKRAAVEGYGATVVECEPTQAARESTTQKIIDESGRSFIPPYNYAHVMAGQGTLALELMEQVAGLDAIVCPVGGGGMCSGVCVAAKGINPNIRIIGAEPQEADDAARSLQSGELQPPPPKPNTVADGLKTGLGALTWPIIRDNVERIITIDEETIVSTTKLVWERMKIVIEPSSAVAVAAALSDEFKALEGLSKVGVVISGGNVDLCALPWIRS